jgi:hypothetical protein
MDFVPNGESDTEERIKVDHADLEDRHGSE